MKKLYFTLPLFILCNFLFAQVPNNDFENWTNAPTLIDWITNSNPLTLPPWDPYIVRKDSDSYSGKWAANFHANSVFKAYATTTFSVPYHPKQLSLYYKVEFPPCVNDSGYFQQDTVSVNVDLLNNGAVVDSGRWMSKTSVSTYSQLLIHLTQAASAFDSCRITIWGGKVYGGCGIVAASTEFWVDDMKLLYSDSSVCIDSSQICACPCFALYDPVCGCDGKTYSNWCFAHSAGNTSWTQGVCGSAPNCNAGFTFNRNDSTVTFTDASTTADTIITWQYVFGDGDTSQLQNPVHKYSAPGTYTVCLDILSSGGCKNSKCQALTIPASSCIDSSIMCFCPCSSQYDPVCGCDGKTYMNSCFAHSAGNTTWTQGICGSIPGCAANFSFSKLDSTFTFSDSSSAADTIISWSYNFGDGNYDSIRNPVHTYAHGSYTVCLTIFTSSGCTNVKCRNVYIASSGCIDSSKICDSCFCPANYDPVCGCDGKTYSNSCNAQNAGVVAYTPGICDLSGCSVQFYFTKHIDTVFFSGSSTAVTANYVWDFGDGLSDTTSNPTHIYSRDSSYTVCLYITGIDTAGQSCISHFCDTVLITHACIDSTILCSNPLCCDFAPPIPVCGCDGITYANACSAAALAGVTQYTKGECPNGINEVGALVKNISLAPNPANDVTGLYFELPQTANTSLLIQNLLGETISQLTLGKLTLGQHSAQVDLSSFSKGVYLIQLRINGSTAAVRKLVKD